MMEILSIENDERKKRLLLLEELEQHGIILKGDEASKAPESTLERLLQEVKSRQDSSTTQDLFMDFYESMVRDYIVKLTIASVFFFSCYPWAALFWPPYYYYNKRSNHV